MRKNPENRLPGSNDAEHAFSTSSSSGDTDAAPPKSAVPGKPPLEVSGFSSQPGAPADQETEVIDRRARWYLASARNAVRVVMPNFRTVADPGGPQPGEPLTFDTAHAALAWFEQERDTLVSTLHAAADHELHGLVWRLPATIYPLFENARHWNKWSEIHLVGLDAARALGNRHGQGRNLLGLADSTYLLGNPDQALEYYAEALDAALAVDDGWIEGFALRQLGTLRWQRNQDSAAPALIRQAIDAFRKAGERRGEGMALLSLADYERNLGHHNTAQENCHAALAIFADIADIADTWSTAWAQCFLGDALVSSGSPAEAIEQYQTAVAVFYEVENRYTEAIAHIGLGRAHTALGDTTQARTHLGAALDLLRSADDPRADEIETELAHLPADHRWGQTVGLPGRLLAANPEAPGPRVAGQGRQTFSEVSDLPISG